MAQFKKGEYVTSKERPELGKGRITDEVDFNQYIVKFDGGDQELFEGNDLVAANACAKNAKFRVGDEVTVRWLDGNEEQGIVVKPGSATQPYEVRMFDGVVAHPKESMIFSNSRGIRSTNPAVNAALNACAKNAAKKPASVLAAKWNAEAKELEDMVRKVTPWRVEMRKMRDRADEIRPGAHWELDENDPDVEKANAAYKRLESARSAASNLWFSI